MSQTTKFPYDIPGDFECVCYEEVNIKLPAGEFSQSLTVEEQILYLYNEVEELKQGGDLPNDILQRITNLETEVAELQTKTAKIDDIETSITNINQEISDIKTSIEDVKSDISSLTLRVDTAETDITEVKDDIVEAKTTANNALTTATEAKSTADNALTTANEAKLSAESVSSVANEAKSTAESASTTANEAKTTAESISSVANEAKTKADNAVTTANEAKSTAESATTVANEAKLSAESVVTIANEAKTSANNAVTTANAAKSTAESAASAASAAQTTAENAQTAADNAASAASVAQTSATNAANAADSANTKATDANIMASNAITKATDAANVANEALGTKWKIVKFIINQNDPNCEVYLGSFYRTSIESASEYHESVDSSFAYSLYFNTELKAAAVVKSNVTDHSDFHDKINFNSTIIIPNHGDGRGYSNKTFNVSSMSSGGYSLDVFDGVTFAIPFQMVKNADNQDLFESFPTYSILASTPAKISVDYKNSDDSIIETIYDNVNIIISVGIKDSVPAFLYTIELPKSSGNSTNLYLGRLAIKFL